MKVTPEFNHSLSAQRTQTATTAARTSFSSTLEAASAASSTGTHTDFTSMTRKEMFDWMNDQIRSGKMSLDESSPFLGMTVKISAASGQPVDMDTDTTRINFIDIARLGIEGALSRNDQDLAERLQNALTIMKNNQG